MNRFLPLLLAFLAVGASAASLDRTPINPVNQPLVVVRAANGDAIEAVLDTRQAKALELDKKDYSGPIFGVDATVDSLRAFAAGLAYGKAENIWYCLSQLGASLKNQSAGMGWDALDDQPDASPAQLAKWLAGLGLQVGDHDLEVRPLGPKRARIAIARDAETRNEIFGGAGGADNGWRDSLEEFLRYENPGLSVWANARPLLGLLTLLTGIDFRAKMNAHNMGVPVSAQIRLDNNKGDLAVWAKLNNLLPKEWPQSGDTPLIVETRTAPAVALNFPTPAGLWDILDLDKDSLLLANIDILPLIPRSVNLSHWRDDAGSEHFSLVCLMGNKDKFNEQLKRIVSWLQVLSAFGSSSFSVQNAQSNWGDELWTVRIGADSLAIGVVDVEAAGKDNAFLVISATPQDWPNPNDFKVRPADNGMLVHWDVNLDPQTRSELIQSLADLSQERGARDFTADFFDRFLPDVDTGMVSMEGKSLSMYSTHCLMPFLVPGVLEMLRKSVLPEADGVRKVADRLRFLLDLANQTRFRALTGPDAQPDKLPGDLSDLLLRDPDGQAWLDREFDRFPGAFEDLSQILRTLASGGRLDGYRYRIDNSPDGWNVTAQNGRGEQMRIDAHGNLSVLENGAWTEHRESFFGMN